MAFQYSPSAVGVAVELRKGMDVSSSTPHPTGDGDGAWNQCWIRMHFEAPHSSENHKWEAEESVDKEPVSKTLNFKQHWSCT